jgi:hypothetical protein
VHVWPQIEDGAGVQLKRAGVVGPWPFAKGHVDGDGRVWLLRMGAGEGSQQAGFFLHGGHGHHVPAVVALAQIFQAEGDGCYRGPVVQRFASDTAVQQFAQRLAEANKVTHRNFGFNISHRQAHIYDQFLVAKWFVSLFFWQHGTGQAAQYAGEIFVTAVYHHQLAVQMANIHPTYVGDAQKPLPLWPTIW